MFLSVITAALRVVGRHNYPSWPTQFRGAGNSARQNGYGSSDDKRVHVDRTQTAPKLVVFTSRAARPGWSTSCCGH